MRERDAEAVARVLAADAELHIVCAGPSRVHRTLVAARGVAVLPQVLDGFEYPTSASPTTFRARLGDEVLEGVVEGVELDAHGAVTRLAVVAQPLPAVKLLGARIAGALERAHG
ncbi:hypothetical protein BJF78_14525 [Pseudonocardia sp. CNS-139]|nr:hypothetical protein BJF78_14525 [Pseudonocardia sp. CNS-139]